MTEYRNWRDLYVPERPADGHKGSFGRVLVIGGRSGMAGAPALSGIAALRGGAGLVTVAVPAGIQDVVAGFEPSYMTVGLSVDEAGGVGRLSGEAIQELIDGQSAVAVGPGLGQSTAAGELLQVVLRECKCPILLDADALNIVAEGCLPALCREGRVCVLTPHPGEFSRLTDRSVIEVQRHREALASEYAKEHGVVVVLKGAETVVTDGEQVFVNSSGNSGMGTGGSGDVLTGLVTSLLAQGAPAFDSAALGVFIHGLAGDIAAENVSQRGLIASDLPDFFGAAWLRFDDIA